MLPLLVIDFGSQYTGLILRKCRELGLRVQLRSVLDVREKVSSRAFSGVILSGGPLSVYNKSCPTLNPDLLDTELPILGICLGMQWLAFHFRGNVEEGKQKEYGRARIIWHPDAPPTWKNITSVWMSHGDKVSVPPPNFTVWAYSESKIIAVCKHSSRPIVGVQFHPEVAETEGGDEIFVQFAAWCGLKPDRNFNLHARDLIEEIRVKKSGTEKVVIGISGGVDSWVTAKLMREAWGKENCVGILVDHGLLRQGEVAEILDIAQRVEIPLNVIDAKERFLSALQGVYDPEEKRKMIGRLFIEVFEEFVAFDPQITWLAQGTLYPDVIESSVDPELKTSHKIKTHHNVGGLPEKMKLKLIEPLRFFFKDEVRSIGRQLGFTEVVLGRHPFPGPGLAVRIMGEVTENKLSILRAADEIFIQFLKKKSLYHKIWQAFAVLLPVKSVGIRGDERSYGYTLVLRAVQSRDGMTADWYRFELEDLAELSNEITNQVHEITRVVLDISSKPPATIEWE